MLDPAPADTTSPNPETVEDGIPALVRHTKRAQWGLAIVVRKLDDRAIVQFQDGRLRKFKEGYYHMLESVDRPYDVTMELVDALRSMLPDEDQKKREKRRRPIEIDEQVEYFGEKYDGGFVAEDYTTTHRGDGRKRPLKRHRDGLVAKAAEKLTRKALSGDLEVAWKGMVSVLKMSDLVAAKERKVFAGIDEDDRQDVVDAVRVLLYGKALLTQRFDACVSVMERAMGQTPSWPLMTFYPGVVHAKEEVVVAPDLYQRQARWMAPGLRCSDRPMGLLYERMRAMVQGVREALLKREFEPRDMLDVRDFMWLTLKPAARTRILEMRAKRRLMQPAEDAAPAPVEVEVEAA